MKKLAGVLRPVGGGRRDDHPIVERRRTAEGGEHAMGRMDDVSVTAMIESGETSVDGATLGGAAVGLPDALTWSATLDPHDDTREVEITDEMVELALEQIERSQVYPFRREAGTPPPVARTVRKADVIVFPGAR